MRARMRTDGGVTAAESDTLAAVIEAAHRGGGHTLANLRPYRHGRISVRDEETPGQDGCAARDLNPEPAD
jgi:hypothetical protein